MLSIIQASIRHSKCVGQKLCRQAVVSSSLSGVRFKSSRRVEEVVTFPSSEESEETPVLLNSKEHAIGYLNKVLNAKIYDAAIETQLQEAKSLSMVSSKFSHHYWLFLLSIDRKSDTATPSSF